MAEFRKKIIFSKSYTTSANIAAGGISAENFISQSDYDTYAPFNSFGMVNSDSVPLGFLLDSNPDNSVPVTAGGSVALDEQQFGSFQIENKSGSTAHTAGSVYIIIQKHVWVPIQEGDI